MVLSVSEQTTAKEEHVSKVLCMTFLLGMSFPAAMNVAASSAGSYVRSVLIIRGAAGKQTSPPDIF